MTVNKSSDLRNYIVPAEGNVVDSKFRAKQCFKISNSYGKTFYSSGCCCGSRSKCSLHVIETLIRSVRQCLMLFRLNNIAY